MLITGLFVYYVKLAASYSVSHTRLLINSSDSHSDLVPYLPSSSKLYNITWTKELVVKPHIHANQYGAVKGSSTCHALVDMLHHWHIGAEICQTSRELLLEYSKVFDLLIIILLLQNLQLMEYLTLYWGGLVHSFETDVRELALFKKYLIGCTWMGLSPRFWARSIPIYVND